MQLKQVFTLFLSLASTIVFAQQNLVPNPGFEDYINCPRKLSEILYTNAYDTFWSVEAWANPIPLSTPDYYNVCDTSGKVSVPVNFNGRQSARTGNGYAGIIAFLSYQPQIPQYSEYIYCKLKEKLIAGVTYNVSFYVSATYGASFKNNSAALDRIGVHFSDTIAYVKGWGYVIDLPFHVRSPQGQILDDTVGWTEISGKYIAKGGEEYMHLGNFWNDTTFHMLKRFYPDSAAILSVQSYYYIDDVSVTKSINCDTITNASDSTLCNNEYITLTSSVDSADSYTWNQGQGTKYINVFASGEYWVVATKDTCDYYIDSFTVRNYIDTVYTTFDTTVCQHKPYEVILSSSAGTGANSYDWNNGSNTMNVSLTDTGTYSCTAIKNCVVYIDNITLKPKEFTYQIDLGNDTLLCEGVKYIIGQPISNKITYEWNTDAKSCCIYVTQSGHYKLSITDGCYSTSDEVNIKFYECVDCISVPTAFTPNNDGLNDLFKVYTKCPIEEFDIIIVNRWGEEVFTSNNVTKGWDGKFKSQDVDAGAYHYLIKYKAILSEKTEVLKGDITLIR